MIKEMDNMSKKMTFRDVIEMATLEVILEQGEDNVAYITELDIAMKVAELGARNDTILQVVCDEHNTNASELKQQAWDMSRQQ